MAPFELNLTMAARLVKLLAGPEDNPVTASISEPEGVASKLTRKLPASIWSGTLTQLPEDRMHDLELILGSTVAAFPRIGDAAFRRTVWDSPGAEQLDPGQAEDVETWRHSLEQLRALTPARVHFCHDAS